jgi:divalent metal cation (Fe/Co/Zn/Cd) transporter
VVIKVWMALFARGLARISKSQVLEADSWNHIFDIAATLLVLAALFGARLGRASLDGWMAIVVAVFIFVTGIKYAREAIDILLGKKPDSEEMEALHRIVEAVEGVLSVHEIMVHHYGDVKMASFHIEVDAALTVIDAHHIAEAAEDAVEHEMEWRALAHVDPVDRSHPFYEELCRFLHDYVDADPEVISVHDVRAAGAAAPYSISFDIVTYKRLRRTRCNALYDRIVKRIAEVLEDRVEHARIGVEAPVDSAPMMRREFDLGAEPEK